MPTVNVSPNVTDVRRLNSGQSIESVCRGSGDGVTVRWNTSELGPDVEFDSDCVDDMSVCRLQLRGPLVPASFHCIAANRVGNSVQAWTLYISGNSVLVVHSVDETRSQAVARIADRTASQHIWGSRDVIGRVTIW